MKPGDWGHSLGTWKVTLADMILYVVRHLKKGYKVEILPLNYVGELDTDVWEKERFIYTAEKLYPAHIAFKDHMGGTVCFTYQDVYFAIKEKGVIKKDDGSGDKGKTEPADSSL